jgi:diadenosine tetraphosphate (Ap4A) HIT family hydrolase
MNDTCIFCNYTNDIIYSNELVYACYDKYPVSEGHVLIITKRHISTWFDATSDEHRAIDEAIMEIKKILDLKYKPDGYNIGMNCGHAAGQSIDHLHLHIIPRYRGDMEQPKGGVRGVIPERRMYP